MTPEPHGPPEPPEDRFVGSKDLTRWKTPVGRFFASAMEWASQVLGPHTALIITLAAGAIIATALAALSAEVYEAVVESDGVAALDQPLLDAAETIRSPVANTAVTAFTNLGGSLGMTALAALALLVLTLRRRSWTPLILMVAAAGGSLLMTIAGKELIGRTRPPLSAAVAPFEYSPSFPSGHSLNSIVIAGIVAYLLVLKQRSKRTRTLTITGAALFAVAMGLSRVFLGHHWFTDVLVAWTLGIAWLATVITIHRLFLTVSYRRAGRSGQARHEAKSFRPPAAAGSQRPWWSGTGPAGVELVPAREYLGSISPPTYDGRARWRTAAMTTPVFPQENDRRHSEDAVEGELEQIPYVSHPHSQDAAEGPDTDD